ncbi:hypothetical protein IG631_12572 [Alternaria alternata]|nr:hypothetical protein IG631_12572 [Alternaria alternata]
MRLPQWSLQRWRILVAWVWWRAQEARGTSAADRRGWRSQFGKRTSPSQSQPTANRVPQQPMEHPHLSTPKRVFSHAQS